MEVITRKRRGSLLLVLLFGTLMAVVVLGMMTLATNLYTVGRESAHVYEDIQDYRATCEIACYQYITELCSVIVEKDLNASWVDAGPTVVDSAIFTQALEIIVGELKSADGSSDWNKATAREAVSGCGVLDPSILTALVAKISNTDVRQVFVVDLADTLFLEFDPETSHVNRDGAYLKVKPFTVEITFGFRGETLVECFTVSGLNLSVAIGDGVNAGGGETEIATMFLSEDAGGVRITRETQG